MTNGLAFASGKPPHHNAGLASGLAAGLIVRQLLSYSVGCLRGKDLSIMGLAPVGYGVIGSTSDSGSLSPGSSPGTPASGFVSLIWLRCVVA